MKKQYIVLISSVLLVLLFALGVKLYRGQEPILLYLLAPVEFDAKCK